MEEKNAMESPMPSRNNNGKIIAGIVTIGVIIIGAVYFLTKNQSVTERAEVARVNSQVQPAAGNRAVKEFNLSSKPFEFSQKEIRVKKGDTVRINLAVEQGLHDWVVDEFNARTKQIKTGESDSIIFVADKAGTFEYYCSVGNHRQMGMVGKLIVE